MCLDLLLLLLALGHVDLEGLVPLDDRAPPEAQEDHAALTLTLTLTLNTLTLTLTQPRINPMLTLTLTLTLT